MERDQLVELLTDHRQALALQMAELAEPVRAPGVQMQFGKRAGDHTADAVLQMTRTISAGQLAQVAGDLDRALEKLSAGTYGICDDCQMSIAPERLEALPWATRCVSCQGRIRKQ